jgi:invasion protein IalB
MLRRFSEIGLRIAGGWCAVGCLFVQPGYAQQPVIPAATQSQTLGSADKFGDWELVCPAPSGETKSKCRLVQNHAAGNGQTALLVTILMDDSGKTPVAVVSVPKRVYLAPGIEMAIDGGPGFKLLYETCDDAGCHAGYKVTGDIAAALRKGTVAAHKIYDSKQKPVVVPVSLKGLSKALDKLVEASK